MTIEEMLNELSSLKFQVKALEKWQQGQIDNIITPELRQAVADIEAEIKPQFDVMNAKIEALTEQIKKAVIANGASVKGRELHAVYNKGRVSWDAKLLEGLALAVPEVLKARSVGEPSVSFRNL